MHGVDLLIHVYIHDKPVELASPGMFSITALFAMQTSVPIFQPRDAMLWYTQNAWRCPIPAKAFPT